MTPSAETATGGDSFPGSKFPPWLVRVAYRSWTLWVPLVVVWPLIALALLPAVVLGAVVSLFTEGTLDRFREFCRTFYQVFCELRGTRVSVAVPTSGASRADLEIAFY